MKAFGFLGIMVIGIFLHALRLPAQVAPGIENVFYWAREAAVNHQDLKTRARALLLKTASLLDKRDSVSSVEVGVIKMRIEQVRGISQAIRADLTRLENAMKEVGMVGFQQEFEIWESRYRQLSSQLEGMGELVEALQNSAAIPEKKSGTLHKLKEKLAKLQNIADLLQADFQVIANIIQIFADIPVELVKAPPGRVLSETWQEHARRTGHSGISNPNQTAKLFSSHSRFAVRDKNPAHSVWACEATLFDLLGGRVKGQEHAYTNNAEVPYCQRCHDDRIGRHNFRWCVRKNSKLLIDACETIEKTGKAIQKP